MEISFISTQELLDEIAKRFDDCMFYGHKNAGINEKHDKYWWDYRGCRMTNIGMCEVMIDLIKKDQEENYQHIEKDDI